MRGLEGDAETERQIARGLRAWSVQRVSPALHGRDWLTVFGTCRSDAIRRASAPARLGEEIHGDVTTAVVIASGWDEPIVWPELRS